MARSLNKSRILASKILALFVFITVFFSVGAIVDEGPLHESFDMLGLLMVAVCALGRLFTTAFLGGHKNESLITEGPFSVVRNPLYVFSWIGFTGIAFMANHVVIIIFVPVFFYVLYRALVLREEAFLEQKFGDSYRAYKQSVPRFIPDFSRFSMSTEIAVNTKLLVNGAKDAVWWFAAYPLVEFTEYVRDAGWIKPLIFIP